MMPSRGELSGRQPRASIVVRTCAGRLEFLQQSLASLMAQTYSSLEIVVIEDGSEDAGPLVRRLAAGSRHSIVYRPIAKSGRCHAGNAGLALATGRLLGFLDDDDQLFPDHVATLAEALAREPSRPAAYSLACEVPTQIISQQPLEYREVGRCVVHRHRWRPEEMAVRNFLPIQGVLFRRELFDRYGGLDPQLDCLEDWDLWRRYLAAGEFAYVPRVTSMHRVPADPAEAHARFVRLQAYRPVLERKWLGPRERSAAKESLSRRLAARALRYAWPFRLYWRSRLWWYTRTRSYGERAFQGPAGPSPVVRGPLHMHRKPTMDDAQRTTDR